MSNAAADVASIAEWVTRRGFTRVALQFPDTLLDTALATSRDLHSACPSAHFYVLADTTFGSCCVDEVAAAHVDAQCVVHFGRSCLSPVSRLPTRLVFPRFTIDVESCAVTLAEHACSQSCTTVVVVDQDYAHALDALEVQTKSVIDKHGGDVPRVVFTDAPPCELEPASPCQRDGQNAATSADSGLDNTLCSTWRLPNGVRPSDCSLVWVGSSGAALLRILMSLPMRSNGTRIECAHYEPRSACWSHSAMQSEEAARLLKRRYYQVQKAKDASIVGIIAGTLSVAGARDALARVRSLAEVAGKKTYTFLVGKPNPAKLGNFPEVDVFVMVACQDTALLESRDFLAPVITAFEAELAFTPGAQWLDGVYSTHLGAHPFVSAEHSAEDDFSLVTGQLRGVSRGGHTAEAGSDAIQAMPAHELASRAAGALAEVTTAAEYLTLRRTYQGLVPVARDEGDAPLQATSGLSGRAASYAGEGQ